MCKIHKNIHIVKVLCPEPALVVSLPATSAIENLLGFFEIIELDEPVAREAIALRQQHRLKLPDAIIWGFGKAAR